MEDNNSNNSNKTIVEEMNSSMEETKSKRQKRNRTIFTCHQLHVLEGLFESNEYPDKLMRERIAKDLDVTEKKINNWFQNRRAKFRKHVRQPAFSATSYSPNSVTRGQQPAPIQYIPNTSWPLYSNRPQPPFIAPNCNKGYHPPPPPPPPPQCHYQQFFTTPANVTPYYGSSPLYCCSTNNSLQDILDLTPPPSVTLANTLM